MKSVRNLLLAMAFAALANMALPAYGEGFLDSLRLPGSAAKPKFLPPDQAFGLKVSVRDANTVLADLSVTSGYYLYRDKTTFSIAGGTANAANVRIAGVDMPAGELKHDANFGDVQVLYRPFQAVISLKRTSIEAQTIVLESTYQGCSEEGLCYPPITKQTTIMLPATSAASGGTAASPQILQAAVMPEQLAAADATTVNENSRIAGLFKQGSFWLIVTFFFGAGLLLAFTPCMFPMVPILSGIIVGRGHKITHAHGFFLSLAYVLGMALAYAVAGVVAGLSGELLSNAMQTPWVLGSFAAVFVLLSLSMFGFYELQLPSALQTRLTTTSKHLHGGHLSGVFVMGALSAIIVSPCVAAPMAGALLYISQTGDAVLGGVALFALALGMGVPLLAIGASAGTLLPKAGAWMESVKRFFGMLMLAVAIWLISPLIPLSVQMLLWAVLLVLSSIQLHALDALPHDSSGWHKLWKGIGILALLLGIAYFIGALSGARDILRPLGGFGTAQAGAPATLQFTRVRSPAELDQRIAEARGKTVMLDFYADWCVSCKEMERYTFSDARVQARLANTVLLKADVTANNDDDKALLKRFELFGPPAILFYDARGVEQSVHRVTGHQDAAEFLQSLSKAGI